MKHSIVLKAVAIVLAAVALAAAVGGAAGLLCLADSGLYNKSVEQLRRERLEDITGSVAASLVRDHIEENLSKMTENALNHSGFFNDYEYYLYSFNEELGRDGWNYAVRETSSGKTVRTNGTAQPGFAEYSHTMSLVYPELLWERERSLPESRWTELWMQGLNFW